MHCSARPCARSGGYEAIRPKPLSPTERLDEVARLHGECRSLDHIARVLGRIVQGKTE
jgi:hypothetical protein